MMIKASTVLRVILELTAFVAMFVCLSVCFVFVTNGFSFTRDFSGADQFVEQKYNARVLSKNSALLGYETGYLLCQDGKVLDVEIDKKIGGGWMVKSEKELSSEIHCSR